MDIKATIREYLRILAVARKPSKDEFIATAKVSSLGLVIIGAIGFVIFLVFIAGCTNLGILC